MSTFDANSFSGSPALRSAEQAGIALSAVICTYNRYDLLPEAIESLIEQQIPVGSLEIIVVDNSADQAGAARFGQRYSGLSNLTYLVEPKPGLSNARNIGTVAALRRIVAFTDDDARACPSWAKELLDAHAAFEGRAGIVGGPIVPRWTNEKPAWIGKPLLGYLSLVDLGHELRELSAGEWLAGCNISFDRESLIAAGGFSTRLGRIGSGSTLLSNDEMETSERVRPMGKLAIYAPKAVVERGGWRAGILDFIDRYQVDVIHVNHVFEMLLAVRIRELVFRRTGRIPRVICDTHDVQAKTYAKRSAENPFNKQQDRYSELLESELSLYRQANALNPLLKR